MDIKWKGLVYFSGIEISLILYFLHQMFILFP